MSVANPATAGLGSNDGYDDPWPEGGAVPDPTGPVAVVPGREGRG